jgi:Tfp pilus assembly protein PilZ
VTCYSGAVDERRQHVRYRVALAVQIKGNAVGVRGATMGNISIGGAFIETRHPPTQGAKVWVLILPENSEAESLPARVVHIDPQGIGVEWETLDDPRRAYLERLLSSVNG